MFTSKCASRHNGVHFFDIWTSKSGARLRCFVHVHFKICFAPQRRATFAFLISPDVSAPAALASLLFDPPEPQIIGKTQCFATFLPFRHLHLLSSDSFFWLFLFSDLLSSNLSLLSASALLCFSSVHIVGSLTSKLPSTTFTLHYTNYTTPHSTPLHYTTRHYSTLRSTPLQSTTPHHPTPHHTTLHYTTHTTLHYITLHYTTLHDTTRHGTTLHYLPLPSATFHYTPLHSTPLHYTTLTTLHYTTLHYTSLHYTTLHYTHLTTLHYTTLHYTTLHYTTLNDTAPQIDR